MCGCHKTPITYGSSSVFVCAFWLCSWHHGVVKMTGLHFSAHARPHMHQSVYGVHYRSQCAPDLRGRRPPEMSIAWRLAGRDSAPGGPRSGSRQRRCGGGAGRRRRPRRPCCRPRPARRRRCWRCSPRLCAPARSVGSAWGQEGATESCASSACNGEGPGHDCTPVCIPHSGALLRPCRGTPSPLLFSALWSHSASVQRPSGMRCHSRGRGMCGDISPMAQKRATRCLSRGVCSIT